MANKGVVPSLVCLEAFPGELERYVFLASATATMMVVFYDATGMRVYAGALSVTTAIASLPNLVYSLSDEWPETAVGGKVISISGGTVYYDIYGDGTTGVASNGVTKGVIDGDYVPTAADMEAITPGFRFGRMGGG